MANSTAAFGLLPFGHLEGSAPMGGQTKVMIASSDTNPVFWGDTVADSTADGRYVTWASSGNSLVRGVFQGCEFYSPSVGRVIWQRYFPASVQTSSGTADVTAYIIDDPEQTFIVKGSTNTVFGTSLVGLNVGTANSSQGSTLDGHSILTLQATTAGSTNSLPFRIVDTYNNYAPPGADGTDNTSVGSILVVRPNNWGRASLTARSS